MRTIIAAVVLLASAVAVEASTCYSIRDYDGRLACLAEERRDPAGGTSIRDWDDRGPASATRGRARSLREQARRWPHELN